MQVGVPRQQARWKVVSRTVWCQLKGLRTPTEPATHSCTASWCFSCVACWLAAVSMVLCCGARVCAVAAAVLCQLPALPSEAPLA